MPITRPQSAVIAPGSIEERDKLFRYLDSKGVRWRDGQKLSGEYDPGDDPDECFYYHTGHGLQHSPRSRYESKEPIHYVGEITYLCSVDEFIFYADSFNTIDFEAAADSDFELLFA